MLTHRDTAYARAQAARATFLTVNGAVGGATRQAATLHARGAQVAPGGEHEASAAGQQAQRHEEDPGAAAAFYLNADIIRDLMARINAAMQTPAGT